jgi:hypothetical protein
VTVKATSATPTAQVTARLRAIAKAGPPGARILMAAANAVEAAESVRLPQDIRGQLAAARARFRAHHHAVRLLNQNEKD